jgi:hypothetical protein
VTRVDNNLINLLLLLLLSAVVNQTEAKGNPNYQPDDPDYDDEQQSQVEMDYPRVCIHFCSSQFQKRQRMT